MKAGNEEMMQRGDTLASWLVREISRKYDEKENKIKEKSR